MPNDIFDHLSFLHMSILTDNVFINKLAGTMIMVAFILILRTMIVRSLMKQDHLLPTVRKRWIVQIKNTSLLLILIILVVIWIEQVRDSEKIKSTI